MKQVLLAAFCLASCCLLFFACRLTQDNVVTATPEQNVPIAQSNSETKQTPESMPTQTNGSNIRSVDFANFTYPWVLSFGDPDKSFTLKNGELPATRDERGLIDQMGVFFGSVNFGDVTGDAAEEAIIFLSIQTCGSSIPGIIYIYTLKNNRLVLLWSRSTGDRADGGFRDAYAENGNLVLELNSSEGKRGACCPIKFERTKYKWNSKKFQQKQKEVLPIPVSR